MGSSLITYILVGPEKLDGRKKQQAVRQARKVIEIVKKWKALEETSDGSDVTKDVATDNLEEFLKKTFKHDLPHLDDSTELQGMEKLLDIEPTKQVEELLHLWHKNTFIGIDRTPDDLNSRLYGRGKSRKRIMVAGAVSWGDDPDGDGYQFIDTCEKLGITSIFGIG